MKQSSVPGTIAFLFVCFMGCVGQALAAPSESGFLKVLKAVLVANQNVKENTYVMYRRPRLETYDIKRTDSMINPIVGIARVEYDAIDPQTGRDKGWGGATFLILVTFKNNRWSYLGVKRIRWLLGREIPEWVHYFARPGTRPHTWSPPKRAPASQPQAVTKPRTAARPKPPPAPAPAKEYTPWTRRPEQRSIPSGSIRGSIAGLPLTVKGVRLCKSGASHEMVVEGTVPLPPDGKCIQNCEVRLRLRLPEGPRVKAIGMERPVEKPPTFKPDKDTAMAWLPNVSLSPTGQMRVTVCNPTEGYQYLSLHVDRARGQEWVSCELPLIYQSTFAPGQKGVFTPSWRQTFDSDTVGLFRLVLRQSYCMVGQEPKVFAEREFSLPTSDLQFEGAAVDERLYSELGKRLAPSAYYVPQPSLSDGPVSCAYNIWCRLRDNNLRSDRVRYLVGNVLEVKPPASAKQDEWRTSVLSALAARFPGSRAARAEDFAAPTKWGAAIDLASCTTDTESGAVGAKGKLLIVFDDPGQSWVGGEFDVPIGAE